MNLQIGKLCSLCLKGIGRYQRHGYTVTSPIGVVHLEGCGFIACDFCHVQVPDAPTLQRVKDAKNAQIAQYLCKCLQCDVIRRTR